jgi:arabinofuranosyltransferase
MVLDNAAGNVTHFEVAERWRARFLLIVALIFFAAHVWMLRHFTIDDAFITYRYARNIASGMGPVFNVGQPVEGYSNPLFTWTLAAVGTFGGSELIPVAGRIIGVLASAGSLVLLAFLPTLAMSSTVLFGVLLTVASTSFALWSVGGLETPLFGFLILLGVFLTLRRPRTTAGWMGMGFVLAGLTLSRPEGVLPATALYLARLIDPATRRDLNGHAVVAAAALIPVTCYLGFRLIYYDEWLPNTYYAKRKDLGAALHRGQWYLVDFIHRNGHKWLYLPAPLAVIPRKGRRAVLISAGVIATGVLFILSVGGDWMDHHRFLAPYLPLVYFIVARGWETAFLPLRLFVGKRLRARFGSVVRIAAFTAAWLMLVRATFPHTVTHRTVAYVNASPYYATIGRLVGLVGEPEWTVAVHDIGAVGWYGGIRVLDLLGLVEPSRARNRTDENTMIAKAQPELVILHYDNHHPPQAPWQLFDVPGFESLYVVPRSPVPLPECFRVRRDVLHLVESRLAQMPDGVRYHVLTMNRYLERRRPDGKVWEKLASSVDSRH